MSGTTSRYFNGSSSSLRRRLGITDAQEVNNWTSLARGHISLDARTQADIGLIRAYIAIEATNSGATNNSDANGASADLDNAFIQVSNDWGTFTAGRTGSFFDFWGSDGPGDILLIDDNTQGSTNLSAFTFAGGNGFSFTLAAEDPMSNGRYGNSPYDDYEGHEFPDGVANIRVDQGWGSAQIMGAVRAIHDRNGFPAAPGTSPVGESSNNTDLGFAVGVGLKIGIPGGWAINTQAGYADGALKYITRDVGGAGDFTGPNASDTNKAWNVRAGISGPLGSPNLNVWANGSYTHVNGHSVTNNTAAAIGAGVFAVAAGATADPLDYNFWAFQTGGYYTFAPGLKAGPEFAWEHVDFKHVANDSDLWGVMWRIQRDF